MATAAGTPEVTDPEDWFDDDSFDDVLAHFESLQPEMTTGPTTDEPEMTVWLHTQLQPDGQYIVTLSIGEDFARELTLDVALKHAVEVLHIVGLADYAQAVRQQLVSLDINPDSVEELLQTLMPRLSSIPEAVTELVMLPAINRKNGEPMLQVSFRGSKLGVWSLQEARSHAMGILETTLAATMDTEYRRVLIDVADLEDGTAAAVINDVGKHRWPQ